jgi:hypothetical protein
VLVEREACANFGLSHRFTNDCTYRLDRQIDCGANSEPVGPLAGCQTFIRLRHSSVLRAFRRDGFFNSSKVRTGPPIAPQQISHRAKSTSEDTFK